MDNKVLYMLIYLNKYLKNKNLLFCFVIEIRVEIHKVEIEFNQLNRAENHRFNCISR
jgi:hypothetical protein